MTPEQFAAVGNLTVTFNELDELLEIWLISLTEVQELRIAEVIVADQSFSQKAELLKKVVRTWALIHPNLEMLASCVVDLIGRTKIIAITRNRLIHSTSGLVMDSKGKFTGDVGFSYGSELVAVNPERILRAVAEIEEVRMSLRERLHDLAVLLQDFTAEADYSSIPTAKGLATFSAAFRSNNASFERWPLPLITFGSPFLALRMSKMLQIDRYARDPRPWRIYAQHSLDASRVLFTHKPLITLCFPAATLGHHAIEAFLKTALICEGMTIFDPAKLRFLDPNIELDKADCAWGHRLVALAGQLTKKRTEFDLSANLQMNYWPHKMPKTINSGLAMFDPFFSELRYPQELQELEGIGPDDVVVLDALVEVLLPFVSEAM